MTYHYKRKGTRQLQAIARAVLERFADRRIGRAVDIEGIIEDFGIDILPRQGFRRYAEGYLAADPRIIVVDERIFTYLPRARFTLAEEICHLILEYDLWDGKELPAGGACHELTEDQHYAVERDAKALAAMILMPDREFESVFLDKVRELHGVGIKGTNALSIARSHAAEEFQVSPMTVGYKALDLKLVQE